MKTALKLLLTLTLAVLLPALGLKAFAETATVPYVNAAGAAQTPKECTVVDPANGEVLQSGWCAVTSSVTFSKGMIVPGDTNLILCDGASLTANDGIWVQENASLTIWAQSTGKQYGQADRPCQFRRQGGHRGD